jgi:hypothetical protein
LPANWPRHRYPKPPVVGKISPMNTKSLIEQPFAITLLSFVVTPSA